MILFLSLCSSDAVQKSVDSLYEINPSLNNLASFFFLLSLIVLLGM